MTKLRFSPGDIVQVQDGDEWRVCQVMTARYWEHHSEFNRKMYRVMTQQGEYLFCGENLLRELSAS